MVEDVRLALGDHVPVELYSRCGGNLPAAEEIVEFVKAHVREEVPLSNA